MKKQIINQVYLLATLASVLSSCGGSSTSNTSQENTNSETSNTPSTSASESKDSDETYYQDINKRVDYDKTNPNSFINNMNDGVNGDVWLGLDGAWHTDVNGAPHNGVRTRNLFYTTDKKTNQKYLAIKGKGFYNTDETTTKGLPEGGVIVSKNNLTPGRYEIKMAALPREGAVTAMWTYGTLTGNEVTSQNEIDIEIGGTTGSNQFEHLWATSWTKRGNKETTAPKVSDQLYLNDGKIHTYTFDWYTNYKNTGVKRVDWFIDGKYITSLDGDIVPEHSTQLWVGVWFPPLWPGNPSFVEDYLLVEEVSFSAFGHSQYYEESRAKTGYTKTEMKDLNIKALDYDYIKSINKLANADFEIIETNYRNNSYNGWVVDSASNGSLNHSSEHTDGSKSFALTASNDTKQKFRGQYMQQTISNSFEGFRFDFKIDAKKQTSAAVGNIELYYTNDAGSIISSEIISIDATEFKTYTKAIVMPKGAKQLRIMITSENETVLYDKASLVYLGN